MHNYIHPLHQQPLTPQKNVTKKPKEQLDFKQLLSATKDVKVSKHAKQRMRERNIELTPATWSEMNTKMIESKQKGVTDAVVILDDISFVVSTKNNTVITALNQEETSKQIFTNINGTIVFVKICLLVSS